LLVYIPDSRLKNIKKKKLQRRFRKTFSHKRFSLNEIKKITYHIWFFFFLIFSCRVGLIAIFAMTDLTDYRATHNSDGIILPYAKEYKLLDTSSRHIIIISIHKEGHIKYRGVKVEVDSLNSFVSKYRKNDPHLLISIIADKKCKMGLVMKVINAIQVSSGIPVFFHTASSPFPFGL
jgi:biopolymer transport protein ExbD